MDCITNVLNHTATVLPYTDGFDYALNHDDFTGLTIQLNLCYRIIKSSLNAVRDKFFYHFCKKR